MPLVDALKHRLAGVFRRASPAASFATVDVVPTAVDSPRPYGVAWIEHNLPTSYCKGEPCQVYVRVENQGSRHWYASDSTGHWVELCIYIGSVLHRTARIPGDVAPGARALLTVPITFPSDAEDGKWTVTVSFVEQNVAWFHR